MGLTDFAKNMFPPNLHSSKEFLNHQAKNLHNINFLYDNKALDLSISSSSYYKIDKMSGTKLSEGTQLIVHTLKEDDEEDNHDHRQSTCLIISYKLKNGDVYSDLHEYIYIRFATQKEVEDLIDSTMENITDETIKGDKNKLPSQCNTKAIIKTLQGFPQPKQGLKIELTLFSMDQENRNSDEDGHLAIILKMSKGVEQDSKVVFIRGFKKAKETKSE